MQAWFARTVVWIIAHSPGQAEPRLSNFAGIVSEQVLSLIQQPCEPHW